MTIDPNKTPSSGDKKIQIHEDNNQDDDKHLLKFRRLLQSTSFLYPVLLTLLLIIGTALLVIIITRRNTCHHLQEERIEASLGLLPKDHVCKTKSILIEYNNLIHSSRQLHRYLV
jgi:Na+(H+)/acetate symporter ActP